MALFNFSRKKSPKSIDSDATQETGSTSRLGWPIFIILGQLCLLALTFGFLGAVHARGQIPLSLDTADFFQTFPGVNNYVFTTFANILALASSFLFAQAVRHALLVMLATRPLPIPILGYGVKISNKSLVWRGQYRWMAAGAAIFLLNLGLTSGWSSLFKPNPITYPVHINGKEFDLNSQPFQNGFSQLWNETLAPLFDTSFLSFIDQAGAASATAQAGYHAVVDFNRYSYVNSTYGIFPIQFSESSTTPTNGSNNTKTQLITSNTEPFPPSTAVSDVSYSMHQQGMTAAVSCTARTLDETTSPSLIRRSQAIAADGFTFTLWNTSTTCGVSGNETVDWSTAITRSNNTLAMVGCYTVDNLNQDTFSVIFDNRGDNSWTYICDIQPQIWNVVVEQTNTDFYIASHFKGNSSVDVIGPMGFAGAYALGSAVGYGQSELRNAVADSMWAIHVDSGINDFTPTLEAYIRGVFEFTATAFKTLLSDNEGPFKGTPPADMTRSINGTAFVHTIGWEYTSVYTEIVLIPIIIFSLGTITIALVAQLYNPGIPRTEAGFDPRDPLMLVAAASTGGINGVFPGIDGKNVEEVKTKPIQPIQPAVQPKVSRLYLSLHRSLEAPHQQVARRHRRRHSQPPAMGSALSTTPTNTDPTKLPISQVFTPPVVPGSSAGEKETYMSIVLVPEYAHWSPDELRYYAYARGTRLPPPGTTMIPFTVAQASTSSGSALLPPTTDGEQFQSISARPEYAGHSFEEHRIAFLKAGSELTSAQIAATFGLGTAVVDQGMDMNPPQNPLTNTTPVVSPFTVPQQPTPAVPSLFGQPAPPVAAPAAFSFGAPSQPPAPVQAATGFSFGAPAAPSQPSGFSFGTQPAAPAQPTGGFSFGQPQQTQPPAQGGFSFGTRRF
ncbi:hypothetical protein MIND_00625800 [Mycena indigotica]|uniref:Uncharacterized protein n=1 Tax=Mycena indigotica TaxID=2126181 RepID=A0A8H6SR41_9AGAR|nr:uncharacterized protein MIND_00625800 [Mycena indigotica]KAF7303951.1 hypothetical protein MIND_00625800 [Mycena indigotica]